jgi:hypothetical protein
MLTQTNGAARADDAPLCVRADHLPSGLPDDLQDGLGIDPHGVPEDV